MKQIRAIKQGETPRPKDYAPGEIFKVGEYWYLTYYETSVSRASVKTSGGKMIASESLGSGETHRQVWEAGGMYWLGDDWYNDSIAKVWRAFRSPF